VPSLSVDGVRPDLPMALLVIIALNASVCESLVVGVIVGMLLDIFAVTPLGLFALVYGLVAALVTYIRENMFVDTSFRHLTIVFLASLVANGSCVLAECIQHELVSTSCAIWALCGSAYTTLLFAIIMYPAKRMRRWLGLTHRVQFSNVR